MADWTPSAISTLLWLDASDSATITIDTGVSQWADKSGNSHHAVNATDSAQPIVSSAWLNGLDVLTFDGNDYLDISSAIGSTVSIFYIQNTTDGTYIIFSDGTNNYGPCGQNSNSGAIHSESFGTPAYYKNGTVQGWTTRDQFHDGFYNTTGIVEIIGADLSAWTSFDISHYTTSTYFIAGKIAEIVVISGIAATDVRQKIEGYLAWKWGLEANLPAGHPYLLAPPETGEALLSVVSQLYNLSGDTLRTIIDQAYSLTEKILCRLEQIYGLRMITVLAQHYGDVPAVRQVLEQYYGSAALLRRMCNQPYGDALRLIQAIDQEWTMPGELRRLMEQRYSIAGSSLLALAEQQYHISEYALIRQQLEQVYIMGADGALVQRPVISVTVDGVAIDPHHISIEIDEAEYAIKGEIHLADQADWLRCRHLVSNVVVIIDTDEYHLIVEAPRRSRPEVGRTEYYVPLSSRAILLDAPYATPISREFSGAMASAIVAEMAALGGLTVSWSLIDWYIPAGTLYANNETPMAVISKIVTAVGGIKQSSPAGVLICRPEYPVSVNRWDTVTPDQYLTDMDNFLSVDSTPAIRDGYNRYSVSNQDAADAGLTLEERAIDASTKEILVYQVPWVEEAEIQLRTSGGSWVTIAADGIISEELTELIEIVAGEGRTAKPIYAERSHAYKQAVLGALTLSEDGGIKTELPDNSLLEIIYSTRYRQYRCSDPQIEDVQFYPEEIV